MVDYGVVKADHPLVFEVSMVCKPADDQAAIHHVISMRDPQDGSRKNYLLDSMTYIRPMRS